MAWSQSDSDVFHRRLRDIAASLVDTKDEIDRLLSLATSEDLQTNLHDAGDGSVTKAEAIAMNGVVQSFKSWMEGTATTADASRRNKLDAYLVTAQAATTNVTRL